MDVVLIILGVLGFGAIVISGYVFTVAARNYVSDDTLGLDKTPAAQDREAFVIRNPSDRRRRLPVTFPLTVNSVVITSDRRRLPERRAAA